MSQFQCKKVVHVQMTVVTSLHDMILVQIKNTEIVLFLHHFNESSN